MELFETERSSQALPEIIIPGQKASVLVQTKVCGAKAEYDGDQFRVTANYD